MKKEILYLCTILLALYFIGCTSNDKPTKETVNKASENNSKPNVYNFEWLNKDDIKICESAGGLSNFYVSEADGTAMMTAFNNIYKTDQGGNPIDALENTYWLSTDLIAEIATYIKTHKNCGLRVYMGCDLTADPLRYPVPPYQNRSTIFISPTNHDGSVTNPKLTKHLTDKSSTMYNGYYASKSPYVKDYTTIAKPRIDKFLSLYTTQKDSLSRSIWIDSCVIYGLNKMLQLNTKTNDGAFIVLAAYGIGASPLPSRQYPLQSTFLIIPSKPNGTGSHDIDWTLIDQATKEVKIYTPPGGFNHGELCPQVCE